MSETPAPSSFPALSEASSAGHWELSHPHADPLVEKIEMAIRVAADLGARAYDAVDGRGLYRSRVEIETDVAALRSASSAARSPDQPSGGTLSEDLLAIASGLEIGRDQAAQTLGAHVANIREIASRLPRSSSELVAKLRSRSAPAAAPSSAGDESVPRTDALYPPTTSIVFRIVAGAMQGDAAKVRHYADFLARKFDAAGETSTAERLRALIFDDKQAVVRAASGADAGDERWSAATEAEWVAERFHEIYERLAPSHGYRTRTESARPWADVPEANRALMVATSRELLVQLRTRLRARDAGQGATPGPADKRAAGLYGKFRVTRTDGRDAPGQKHDGCEYFVLDLTHDEFATPAIEAYAKACAGEFPALAKDLRRIVTIERAGAALTRANDDPRSLPRRSSSPAAPLPEGFDASTLYEPHELAPPAAPCSDGCGRPAATTRIGVAGKVFDLCEAHAASWDHISAMHAPPAASEGEMDAIDARRWRAIRPALGVDGDVQDADDPSTKHYQWITIDDEKVHALSVREGWSHSVESLIDAAAPSTPAPETEETP